MRYMLPMNLLYSVWHILLLYILQWYSLYYLTVRSYKGEWCYEL